ncbi:hypothetical protein EDC65_4763 [Stella humosa]|uniref:Uncharacterized protein n=1 Tax=Stella humosa TaxID=94 RepID=A0A3N1KX97_9PROT|nr:hypothetical protein [Stella humosa]ROP83230.1 hypothetical protein EDC65_4763 [Stella humosa]BBK29989.1 hypothetical protein STHU_06230 [Stella humosa]
MNALLRLLAVGRAAASVRSQAKLALLRTAIGALLAILVAVGMSFLVAAGYMLLRRDFTGPEAAGIVGGSFLLLALIVAIAGQIVLRRQMRQPVAPAIDPTAATMAAVGPLISTIGSVSPAVLAAAVAGFIYGLRGKK